MDKLTKSKLVLSLITPDLISVWNQVVNDHGVVFTLDYTTHSPMLLISAPGINPEVLMMIDTRRKKLISTKPNDERLYLAYHAMVNGLAEHEAAFTIRYNMNPKTKQKFASLRFIAAGGGNMNIVLHSVKRGGHCDYVDFALNERW